MEAREASIRLLACFENLRAGWSVLEGRRERREAHSLSAPRRLWTGHQISIPAAEKDSAGRERARWKGGHAQQR